MDDAVGVTALLKASYPELMGPAYDPTVLAPALELMTRAQPALLVSGTYYVAELPDKAIVGCGGWTKERPGDGEVSEGVGHVRHFGTHPDWTRHGIGRAIYERCEIDARNAGLNTLECYSSLNAEGFYSAMGFERIGEFEIPMANHVEIASVHMKRRI